MQIRQTNQGFNFDKYPNFEKDIDPKQRAWIEINCKALETNVRNLKSKLSKNCQFMAVVKADGYGHDAEVVFRNSIDLALSYFIKGEIAEDNGFALKPWEKIELNELNVINGEKNKIAMGTFNFKPLKQDQFTLVAFTFFFTTSDGSLKIKVHHSSPVT